MKTPIKASLTFHILSQGEIIVLFMYNDHEKPDGIWGYEAMLRVRRWLCGRVHSRRPIIISDNYLSFFKDHPATKEEKNSAGRNVLSLKPDAKRLPPGRSVEK